MAQPAGLCCPAHGGDAGTARRQRTTPGGSAVRVESQQPPYARNPYRSIRPEILVLVGLCTHLGCVPARHFEVGSASGLGDDWPGGWFCHCHGSKFDLAGRVFRNVPAPANLVVPSHRYVTHTRIVIGVDPTGSEHG